MRILILFRNKLIKRNDVVKNFFRIFLPIILGGIVGFIINGFIDYTELVKPPLAPPKIFFPIAWSIIYLLMGISYYLYRKDFNDKKTIQLYYAQLIVNLLWSIIFFVFKLRLLAIAWILVLDILVIILIKRFFETKKISTYLNIPYLLWILFATYLTIGIYILN